MSQVSNAPIVIPKSGDTALKKDSLVTLTARNFSYTVRTSPRAGTPSYFSISESPIPNLNFNRLTGKLEGVVTVSGVFQYRITAYNDFGSDYVDVEIAVRKRGFTANNYLSELAESTDLQNEALRNLNIDPDTKTLLQQISDENPPFIRNDFNGIVGFSRKRLTDSANDVQGFLDQAEAQATAISGSLGNKITKTNPPLENMESNGVFVATTFLKGSGAEITESQSLDFPVGETQWTQINGDGDKIRVTPPAPRATILIEGSLTVDKGFSIANTYFEKGSASFETIKATCEAPLNINTKIQHYNIAINDAAFKLPIYKP